MMYGRNYSQQSPGRDYEQSIPPNPSEVSDAEHLQRMSAACRAHLDNHPEDLTTRLSLAWHLFFQALYYKYQQAFWNRLLSDSEQQEETIRERLHSFHIQITRASPDPRRLLKDSLMQASTVLQLGAEAHTRDEAAKILELAALLGDHLVVHEVDTEAGKILTRIARAIYAEKRDKTHLSYFPREEELDRI
jgi:hypothetical protein